MSTSIADPGETTVPVTINMVDHTVQVHQGGRDEVREGGKGQTDRKQGGIKGINSQSLKNRLSERRQMGKIRARTEGRVFQR